MSASDGRYFQLTQFIETMGQRLTIAGMVQMKGRRLFGLMVVAGFSISAMAEGSGFAHVLALAQADEGSLAGQAANELKHANNEASLGAFAACMPNRTLSSNETRFVVVAELDRSGTVEQTWRQGESELAQCFEAHLKGVEIYKPAVAPFYVYFDVR